MEKQWREFGDNNSYRVSNHGDAQSNRSGEWKSLVISKAKTDNHGGFYLSFQARIGGKFKTCRIHRMVAELFIRRPEKLEQVNHIDGNRENNRLDNLEIVSAKENIQNALKRGSFHKGKTAFRGVINEGAIGEIKEMINAGMINKTIAAKYDVDPSNISKIRHGKWKSLKYIQNTFSQS